MKKVHVASISSLSSSPLKIFSELSMNASATAAANGNLQGACVFDKYNSSGENIVETCPCDASDHYEMTLLNDVVDIPVQFLFMALFYNAGISSTKEDPNDSDDDKYGCPSKTEDPLISEFRRNIMASRGIIGDIHFCDSISDDSFSLFDNLKDTPYNIPNNSEEKPYPTLNLKYTIPITNNLGMALISITMHLVKKKETECYESIRILYSKDCSVHVVEVIAQTPSVPFGDCFYTLVRYCITAAGVSKCNIFLTSTIIFCKQTFMKPILKTFVSKALVDYKNSLLDVIKDTIVQVSMPQTSVSSNRKQLDKSSKLNTRDFTDPFSHTKYSFLLSETPVWILYLLPIDEGASFAVKLLYYINQALSLFYSLDKGMLAFFFLISLCVNMYFMLGFSSSLDMDLFLERYVEHSEPIYELMYNSSLSSIPETLDCSLNKAKNFIFQATQAEEEGAFQIATDW